MTTVEIEALLMSLIPAITAITAIIVVATKMLKAFKALIEIIRSMLTNTENKELMAQLKTVHAENQKLKKVMTQFIEAQSRVHYDDMTGNENDKKI